MKVKIKGIIYFSILVLSIGWYLWDPSFEPLIGILVSILGIFDWLDSIRNPEILERISIPESQYPIPTISPQSINLIHRLLVRARQVSPSLYGILLLCFFLPFITYSCWSPTVATGYELVQSAHELHDLETPDDPEDAKNQQLMLSGVDILQISLILAIVGLFASFFKNRIGTGLAAIVGIAGWALFVRLKQIGDQININNLAKTGENFLDYEWGFWAAFLFFCISGIVHLGFFALYANNQSTTENLWIRSISRSTISLPSIPRILIAIATVAFIVFLLPKGYELATLTFEGAVKYLEEPSLSEEEKPNIFEVSEPVIQAPLLNHIDEIAFGGFFAEHIAALEHGDVHVYDLKDTTLVPINVIEYGDVPNLSYSTLGTIATVYSNGTVDLVMDSTGNAIERYENETIDLFGIPIDVETGRISTIKFPSDDFSVAWYKPSEYELTIIDYEITHTISTNIEDFDWSPDGSWLAGVNDTSLTLWNVETGLQYRLIKDAQLQGTNKIFWSPTSSYLATGSKSNNSILIWGTNSWTIAKTLRGYNYPAAWSQSGMYIAATQNNSVVIIDSENWQPIISLRGSSSEITGIAWSSVDELLATSDSDGVIRLWLLPEEIVGTSLPDEE